MTSQYGISKRKPDEAFRNKLMDESKMPKWLATLVSSRFDTSFNGTFGVAKDILETTKVLNVDKAVNRLASRLQTGEMIYILSDFDADGIGSSAIADIALSEMGYVKGKDYIIDAPNRLHENHGLSEIHVLKAHERNAKTIVCLDNGSSSFQAVQVARSLGMDVIVIDHHDVPSPNMKVIMVNPKNPMDKLGDVNFCGAGLTYIVMGQLAKAMGAKYDNNRLSQIAAISTIADVVPLGVNNRNLVRFGISNMRKNAIPLIRSICKKQNVNVRTITSTDIGWKVAPLLNAVGRLMAPDKAVAALTSGLRYSDQAAMEMFNVNKRRQDMLAQTMSSEPDLSFRRGRISIVVAKDWHIGIVGLYAGRMAQADGRMVYGAGTRGAGDRWRVSFRSPGIGANIGAVLIKAAKKGIILGGGGHDGAGGCTVDGQHLDELTDFMNMEIGTVMSSTVVDGIAKPSWWNVDKVREMGEVMQPFGNGNPVPQFTYAGTPERVETLSGGKHLVMYFDGGIKALAFGEGDKEDIVKHAVVKCVYSPSINSWRGKDEFQMIIDRIVDIEPVMDENMINKCPEM